MYSSQSESNNVVSTVICHSCGRASLKHQNKTTSKIMGLAYALFGWVFFAISLLFLPIVFGSASMLMGFLLYHNRSQVHGMILMFFAMVGLVIGTLISVVVAGTIFI